MWLLFGFALSLSSSIFGLTPYKVFNVLVHSNYSLAFIITAVFFYYHRKIFKKDLMAYKDIGHFMVLASVTFLPLFIYMIFISLSEQLIRGHYLDLSVISETLRFSFTVIVPVYFITLLISGLAFAGANFAIKKLLFRLKK
jgi:hypothetical protein